MEQEQEQEKEQGKELEQEQEQERGGVGAAARVELDAGAQVEVAPPDWGPAVAADTEHALRPEVPVGDSPGVEELQGGGHVRDDHGSLLLGEELPLLDVIQELATGHLLEDQVEAVRLLKVLDQLDDVIVALDVVEEVDLLEDPGPAVPRCRC